MSQAAPSHGRRLRVGMVLYGDLAYDGRVRREATTLARAGYQVALVCVKGTEGTPDLPPGVDVLVRRPAATSVLPGASRSDSGRAGGRPFELVRQGRWLVDYARNVRSWGHMAVDACSPVDIWHAHDLPSLVAIAPAISSGVPVIYDSHELFLEFGAASRLPGVARALLRRYERHLVARVAAVVTVNESLARVLRHRYRPKRLVIVYNAPERWDPPADRPDYLRQALGLGPDVPVALYHGGLAPDRGLVQLAEAMLVPGLERAHLAYVGFGVLTDELVALSREPRYGGRIHVLPAVSVEDLPEWVASADVSVMPNQPTSANDRLSTPNKLFQSLAVGIPVVTSDFPERRRIVVEDPDGPLGETCDPTDPANIGEAIRRIVDLDPAVYADLRRRCLKAAHERWNWATEAEKLVALYADVVRVTTPVGPAGASG
jgi:glycosyltransferase involved in cell wall biosynthesis